jgi:serine/threonine protein kinase
MTRLSDGAVGRLRDIAGWPDVPPDRYEIRSLLGRGGMGAVYAAHDRLLDREVALKVSNAMRPDASLEARLRQEAGVLAKLEHPGIVPVHDAAELADGRWFYVMKLVRGNTLTQQAATLAGEAAILGTFERIVETVAFAHAAGIIHRDLKPSNVMVGSFGEVLVLDWGVAKVLASPASDDPAPGATVGPNPDQTAAGVRLGTPGFMAPEQHAGHSSEASPAADVYSLGAILRWMLAETRPPRRLRAIVGKCLAETPAERYPNAGALNADLARYRAGLAVEAHPESALERAWRWLERYRTFIGLVGAYLIMRVAFAWFQRQ